jgi:DNA repair exonuclease SbcCD ATPase subunit
MADLRTRFIEDYAGGLLNVARQEFSSSGEVASQDGLPTDGGTLFVEDGTGTKSGLKLGVSLAEVLDPTTEEGCVNVRFADRTYAKLRDLKLFTTAIASAQAALSEASSTSISNLETTLQLLETDISSLQQSIQTDIYDTRNKIEEATSSISIITPKVADLDRALEVTTTNMGLLTQSLSSLTTQFGLFKQETQESLADLDSRLTSAQNSYVSLEARVVLLEELNSVIASIQTSLSTLDQRVTVLETTP